LGNSDAREVLQPFLSGIRRVRTAHARLAAMRVRRCLLVALVVASGVACSGGTSLKTIPRGASAVGGGCGSTALYRGASLAWTRSAGGPMELVQATGHEGDVVAYLFGYPLRAGHPVDPANKILWVVRLPRDGSNLTVFGHPLGTTATGVTQQLPPDSSPGEIYPSIVDVPLPGCWEFALRWHGHVDTVELPYR